MKFNGTSWVYVGDAGFSAGPAAFVRCAFGPNSRPYVTYRDAANGQKASVMTYDGASWVNVGNAGFSDGRADFTDLIFNNSGVAIVGYQDFAHQGKVTVKNYIFVIVGMDGKEQNQLSVFPNPATDFVQVNLAKATGTENEIRVMDVTGKMVYSTSSDASTVTLNVSGFASGIYFVQVKNSTFTVTGKFFKK
jgi:hypothetical protein